MKPTIAIIVPMFGCLLRATNSMSSVSEERRKLELEAEEHATNMHVAFDKIESDFRRGLMWFQGNTGIWTIDYERMYDELHFYYQDEKVRLSDENHAIWTQLMAINENKCTVEAIKNMEGNVRDADVEWFIQEDRCGKVWPKNHVQIIIVRKACKQAELCKDQQGV